MSEPAQGSGADWTAAYTPDIDSPQASLVRPAYTSAVRERPDGSLVYHFGIGDGWVAVVTFVRQGTSYVVAELDVLPEREHERRLRGEGLPEGSGVGSYPAEPEPERDYEPWAARWDGLLIDPADVPYYGITTGLLRSLGIGSRGSALSRALADFERKHGRASSLARSRSVVPAPPGTGRRGKRPPATDDDVALAAMRWLDVASTPGVGPRRAIAQHVTRAVNEGQCPQTKPAKERAYRQFRHLVKLARDDAHGYLPPAMGRNRPPAPAVTPKLRRWAAEHGMARQLAQIESRIAPPDARGRDREGE